jgi:peptidoglycan/LPS O-acetylase OafA/YrhL
MKRLELLDYGRFAAAGCVIAFHYLFNGIQNGKISSITHIPGVIAYAKYGYLGVDFFFMISGYVIFFSAHHKTAGAFLVSRAVRLYPAFWSAVILTSIVAQFWGGTRMSVSLPQAIDNLTMFPVGHGFVDGVYWTLQLEWCFYLAVLACLMMGFQNKLRAIFLVWPFVMMVAQMTDKQWLPYLGGHYGYFAAGSIFAIQKQCPTKRSVLVLLICLYLCISFSVGNAAALSESKGVAYSASVIGLIIFLQFVFFLFLNSRLGSSLKIPGSRLAGGLTYPLYLVHAHLGYMVISRFATNENRWRVYLLSVLSAVLIACLIHQFVEQRFKKRWHALFSRAIGTWVDGLQNRIGRFLRYAPSSKGV